MSAPVDTAPGCGRVRVPSPASPPLSRRSPGDPPGLRARLARALPAGSLRRRLAGGALWSTVGAAAAQGLGLVAQALAARALGASGYGGLAVVLATVALLSELVTAGVGLTATRFVAEHRERDPARAGRILGLGAAVALAAGVALAATLALAAPLIARVALGTPELAPALRLAAP
ncbi:MAG TPA: oligosaccharide flippase family protein, partial [Anaeromyxobacteraceae bacterium]|nr:oligosaccharide flippase family protein [Anaeromyxobacteraceae bacterium]